MSKLTNEMIESLKALKTIYVATTDKSGKPNVSAKGSHRVIDESHLAFANVNSPGTVANLLKNNKISVILPGDDSHKGCRIWGTAEVLDKGEIYDQYAASYAERNMKIKNIVVITIEEVLG